MAILFPGQFKPLGFESITLTDGEASLLTVPTKAIMALVQSLGNPVNWRDDGEAPIATLGGGMVVPNDLEPSAFIGNIRSAQFISTSMAGSTLLVSFYG